MRRTTVRSLVLNFANACRDLTPFLDHVAIPWREGEAYDNWDRIAEPLFLSMVTEPCIFSAIADPKLRMHLKVCRYGFSAEFEPDAYVAVDEDLPAVLIGLSSTAEPFDQVLMADGEHIKRIPLADAEFVFMCRVDNVWREFRSIYLQAE